MTITTPDPKTLDSMSASLDKLTGAYYNLAAPQTTAEREAHSAVAAAMKELRAGIARLRLGRVA